jgi:hypothetical protein
MEWWKAAPHNRPAGHPEAYVIRDEWWHCIPCGRLADEGHCVSGKHLERMRWFEEEMRRRAHSSVPTQPRPPTAPAPPQPPAPPAPTPPSTAAPASATGGGHASTAGSASASSAATSTHHDNAQLLSLRALDHRLTVLEQVVHQMRDMILTIHMQLNGVTPPLLLGSSFTTPEAMPPGLGRATDGIHAATAAAPVPPEPQVQEQPAQPVQNHTAVHQQLPAAEPPGLPGPTWHHLQVTAEARFAQQPDAWGAADHNTGPSAAPSVISVADAREAGLAHEGQDATTEGGLARSASTAWSQPNWRSHGQWLPRTQ